MTEVQQVCKDCNQCIHEADDGIETHMCSLCKRPVIGIDDGLSDDAIEVMSK